ncbi:DUF6455 family protein [Aquibium sp. A9E412]|uniref:DUF6455 family protein n=1 Tax=Aquibium sp. A9E412 TaxID=2976767 RepID=UPI0025AF05B2|nr:DUF6455 family protein [Aquibium sp. A9E412]MDN2565498.1 DUF6455 family protein [Aquibium sp. A9E412]
MSTLTRRIEDHARKMGAMMERCGVDAAMLANDRLGLTLAQASRACLACRAEAACTDWLAASAGTTVDAAPDFCPNAARFDFLRNESALSR